MPCIRGYRQRLKRKKNYDTNIAKGKLDNNRQFVTGEGQPVFICTDLHDFFFLRVSQLHGAIDSILG